MKSKSRQAVGNAAAEVFVELENEESGNRPEIMSVLLVAFLETQMSHNDDDAATSATREIRKENILSMCKCINSLDDDSAQLGNNFIMPKLLLCCPGCVTLRPRTDSGSFPRCHRHALANIIVDTISKCEALGRKSRDWRVLCVEALASGGAGSTCWAWRS